MAITLPAVTTTCGFCEYIAGTRECAFVRRGPLVSSLVSRALVEGFGATGVNLFQNNGIDANQHYPHYHLHVVPRYPGGDPTRIYRERQFERIPLEEQHRIAQRIRRALA